MELEPDTKSFKRWYLVIIGIFYLGQGYALSSLVLLLPIYILNELGVDTRSTAVAISALIIFPWYIKFVFGLLSDNYPIQSFRRRPYLIIATLFSVVGWTTLGTHNVADVWFIASGVSLAIGSSLADATIDGMVVEMTPPKFIGRIQGVAWGGRGLGIGSAGVVSSQLVDIYGWNTMFNVAAEFGISISIIALILPESRFFHSHPGAKIRYIRKQVHEIITDKKFTSRFSFFVLSGFALSIILQLTLIMETEFEYSLTMIGYGALTFAIGNFFGAIGSGIIVDRNDSMRIFNVLSVLYAMVILSGLLVPQQNSVFIDFLFFFGIGLFGGGYEAYQLKVIQEETVIDLEGTLFAIWTGISNLGQFAFGGLVIVSLADLLGIQILWTMQIVLVVIVLTSFVLKRLKFS